MGVIDFVLVALCVVYYYKPWRAQKELKDCCSAMRESGAFSDEEIESVAKRLTK